jgi:hypothetical protein
MQVAIWIPEIYDVFFVPMIDPVYLPSRLDFTLKIYFSEVTLVYSLNHHLG